MRAFVHTNISISVAMFVLWKYFSYCHLFTLNFSPICWSCHCYFFFWFVVVVNSQTFFGPATKKVDQVQAFHMTPHHIRITPQFCGHALICAFNERKREKRKTKTFLMYTFYIFPHEIYINLLHFNWLNPLWRADKETLRFRVYVFVAVV